MVVNMTMNCLQKNADWNEVHGIKKYPYVNSWKEMDKKRSWGISFLKTVFRTKLDCNSDYSFMGITYTLSSFFFKKYQIRQILSRKFDSKILRGNTK